MIDTLIEFFNAHQGCFGTGAGAVLIGFVIRAIEKNRMKKKSEQDEKH